MAWVNRWLIRHSKKHRNGQIPYRFVCNTERNGQIPYRFVCNMERNRQVTYRFVHKLGRNGQIPSTLVHKDREAASSQEEWQYRLANLPLFKRSGSIDSRSCLFPRGVAVSACEAAFTQRKWRDFNKSTLAHSPFIFLLGTCSNHTAIIHNKKITHSRNLYLFYQQLCTKKYHFY